MRLAILALVSMYATGACGEKPRPRRPGEEYLKAIEVEGNRQLGDDQLVSGLALQRTQQRGRAPDPYLIQVDADRIRGEYLRKGFLGVDVRSRVEHEGDAATVVYAVEEGKRATTRVVVRGIADPALVAKVREALPLRDGEPFDYATYDEAKPMLTVVVENAGYARATLTPTVWADRANQEAIIELAYDLGPKCTFGTVEITGVDGALADAVRDRVQFDRGDTFSLSAITATQRQLYAMQRFSTVQVQTDEGPDDPVVDVKVAVAEAARHEVRLGGGFGIDPTAYEVRGRAGYEIVGFPTPMDRLVLDLRPAYGFLREGAGWEPRIRALSRLQRQDLFWTYSTGEVEAGYNYLAIEAYTSFGPRGQLAFGTPLGHERVQLRLAWEIERVDFRNISPLLSELEMMLHLDEANRLGSYQQLLSVDLRDNPLDTHAGVFGQLAVIEGTRFAGGQFDYVQLIPELRGYVPLGSVVLAGKARVGTFWGDVPPTKRFFSGGASNHRGFGERELSPFVRGDVDGSERTISYGGSSLVETSVEARIPITTWREMGVGTVVFLDGGDVTNDVGDLSATDLFWAIGTGLRLNTVVGPVRLDVGYRLNRTGPMEPAAGERFAFHLSIGEAF